MSEARPIGFREDPRQGVPVKTMTEVIQQASGKIGNSGAMVYLDVPDVKRIADALTVAGFGPVKAAAAGALRDAAGWETPLLANLVFNSTQREMLRSEAAVIEADQ